MKNILLMLCALIMGVSPLAAQSKNIVVHPKEIDTVLVNPGIGIETFQRFNGDPINAGLKWSEAGPTTQLQTAASKPDFPASSISYCRWFWETLEPEPGKIRWEIIDRALAEARAHHQTLAIRMMPYDERHPLPEWYRNSGAHRANLPSDPDGAIWQPDFRDPLYLKYWGQVVMEAGKRYDGNPYLESVDISTVGYWGEGWSNYMPAFKYQKALIDVYLNAFKRTPLLMNFDQARALGYAVSHGSGWRLDCWGDMGALSGETAENSLMIDMYPEQIASTGIADAWKRSPVSLESCWVPGFWLQKGWNVDYILDQALQWHTSYVNIKSSAIPAEWKAKFDDFEKKLGYRFVLRRLEYPAEVAAGSMMPVQMYWRNEGDAPTYRDYVLAVEFSSSSGSDVIRTPAKVRKWLPGDSVFNSTIYVPARLTPGNYRFRVALLDPRTGKPAIKLAIEGRQPDGWYDVGAVAVTEAEK